MLLSHSQLNGFYMRATVTFNGLKGRAKSQTTKLPAKWRYCRLNPTSALLTTLLTENFSLREKRPYSEFFWPPVSRIRTKYGETPRISQYSVRMRENTDQKNFEYGHFSCSTYKYENLLVKGWNQRSMHAIISWVTLVEKSHQRAKMF